MPLYEYRCTECDATLEAIRAFAAPPLEECPECGRSSLKKLLSAPAFQFKGSGWYVNDYARKDKSAARDAKSEGAADGKGESGKGESGKGESSSDSGKKAAGSTSSPSSAAAAS